MKTDKIDQILNSKLYDMESVGVAPSWDDFESRRNKSKTIIKRFVMTGAAAAVAASVALLLILMPPNIQQAETPYIQAETTSETETVEPIQQTVVPESTKPYITPNVRVKNIISETTTHQEAVTEKTIPQETPAVHETVPATPETVPATPRKPKEKSTYNPAWRGVDTEKTKSRPRLAMSAFANISGNSGSNLTRAANQVMQADASPGVLHIQMGKYKNTVDFTNSDVNHKFPISAGVALSIPIGQGFAVETGVAYTYLESTSETTQDFTYKYQQNIHYIGVPVSVAYKILNIRAIDVYAAVGATAELPVAADVKTKIYSGNKHISSDSKNVEAKGLQMSLNAAVGINVHLTPRVGIYIEPNLNHYFRNANQPITSRTQSDIQFNVRAGFKIQL